MIVQFSNDNGVFQRSGLAALSDLEDSGLKEIFARLEKHQDAFLAKESAFRSPEYKWPRDPLHEWSRAWEYPYVYYHLKRWHTTLGHKLVVADLGSGVTFFPYAVATEGHTVIPMDIDPICAVDYCRANKHITASPGAVDFRLITDGRLPLEDSAADVVYCISVIEHVPQPKDLIQEVVRILKPGGLFLLTMDIALDSTSRLQPAEFNEILRYLDQFFRWQEPERSIHPQDLLTSRTSPFCGNHKANMSFQTQVRTLAKRLTAKDAKPLTLSRIARGIWHRSLRTVGLRKPQPMNLACYGAALFRK